MSSLINTLGSMLYIGWLTGVDSVCVGKICGLIKSVSYKSNVISGEIELLHPRRTINLEVAFEPSDIVLGGLRAEELDEETLTKTIYIGRFPPSLEYALMDKKPVMIIGRGGSGKTFTVLKYLSLQNTPTIYYNFRTNSGKLLFGRLKTGEISLGNITSIARYLNRNATTPAVVFDDINNIIGNYGIETRFADIIRELEEMEVPTILISNDYVTPSSKKLDLVISDMLRDHLIDYRINVIKAIFRNAYINVIAPPNAINLESELFHIIGLFTIRDALRLRMKYVKEDNAPYSLTETLGEVLNEIDIDRWRRSILKAVLKTPLIVTRGVVFMPPPKLLKVCMGILNRKRIVEKYPIDYIGKAIVRDILEKYGSSIAVAKKYIVHKVPLYTAKNATMSRRKLVIVRNIYAYLSLRKILLVTGSHMKI